MTATLDDVNNSIQQLVKMQSQANSIKSPNILGEVKLTSSNLTQGLNINYNYSITLFLVGTVSSDVPVYIQYAGSETANLMTVNLNNTRDYVKIEGFQIDKIYTTSTGISTATVYVGFIGYSKQQGVDLSA